MTQHDIFDLRNEAEKILAGAIGSSIAAIIFEDKLILTEMEREDLSRSVKDITENLRLSRQELAEANRQLSYLKEFSENIIESAPVGIKTIDSLSRIKYWNREMEAITGIRKPDASNRTITHILPWMNREILIQNKHKDSIVQTPSLQFFKINISPFKDPSGGFVVIIEDITEKMRMEEQLVQASKLASIGRLTAGISHEIGNPLASISSLVQELRSMKMDSKDDIEFSTDSLKTINSHIERIAKIVRSLGDFARISTAEKTPANIAEILDRTINLVKYDKRFKNINLKTEVGEIPLMKVNPDKIQQVFMNFILNAMDAMPSGGSLNISMKQAGSWLR